MNPQDTLALAVTFIWLIVLAVFALPSVIAFWRGDPKRWLILATNVSMVGWVMALVLAVYPLLRLGRLIGSDHGDAG